MIKQQQSFTELLDDAKALLMDQPKQVRELIYWVCTLDNEARAALSMAYNLIYGRWKEETDISFEEEEDDLVESILDTFSKVG